jgi:glycosyltransferase involved in cell wall biosynthesis
MGTLVMPTPFFSIIIPTFNRHSLLKIAIESVLSQTYPDFELIIIDDGSSDNTALFCEGIADKRLLYSFQVNQGVSSSRNNGIQQARGRFICFLDSDDRFRPDKLAITRDYIEKFPDFKIFHSDEIWFMRGKLLNQKKIHQKPDGNAFEKSLHLCCISPSAVTISKEVFERVGGFDETLPACEDYDLWLRVTAHYPIKLIPEALTIKAGGHADQLSKKYPAMDTLRIYALKKLLDANILTLMQRESAIKELKRKCVIYIKGAEKREKIREVHCYTDIMHTYDKL